MTYSEYIGVPSLALTCSFSSRPRSGSVLYGSISVFRWSRLMENEEAGYFIQRWRELGNQVSRMIIEDSRYQAIKARQTARFELRDGP